MTPWPSDVGFARLAAVTWALASLSFGLWYLRGWYWLPRPSLRRIGGLAWMAIFSVFVPVAIYRANVERGHRDLGVSGIIMLHAVILVAMFLYMAKRKSVEDARKALPQSLR
jgi:hypothetical protein